MGEFDYDYSAWHVRENGDAYEQLHRHVRGGSDYCGSYTLHDNLHLNIHVRGGGDYCGWYRMHHNWHLNDHEIPRALDALFTAEWVACGH